MKLDIGRLDLARLESLKDDVLRVVCSRESRPWVGAALAVTLVLGVWWVAVAHPAAARLAALEKRQAAARRQIASLAEAGAVDREKARVAALESRVRDAVARMAQDIQFVQILKQLASQAARYRIVVERLDVTATEAPARKAVGAGDKPPPPLEIRTQRLELELSCSYEAAARFVDDLKTLPALVIVEKLEIERDPTGSSGLRVVLTLKIHSVKQLPAELTA